MVPDHSTKHEEHPSIHHEGMYNDGQTDVQKDRWPRPIPIFPDSTIAEWGIIKLVRVLTGLQNLSNLMEKYFQQIWEAGFSFIWPSFRTLDGAGGHFWT